ncbi:MAG: hypothetical protein JO307_29315 [Bryobacterales bacterium]|nr:hypothetical protein [Bryobacterales bacterium]
MSFSLGIAAATAMFSVIDGVIIHPFIYAHPETLMSIYWWENDRNRSDRPYTPEAYLDIAERSNIFEGVIASTISDVLLTGTSNPERLRGNFVTRTCSRFLECSPG